LPTVTPKPLVQGALLPNAAAASPGQYRNTGVVATVIHSMTFCNTDSSSRTVTCHLVPSGGSASVANMILDAVSIATTATFTDLALRCLSPGDFITAFASTASVVSFRVDGFEET
jgi:hypothetical protein